MFIIKKYLYAIPDNYQYPAIMAVTFISVVLFIVSIYFFLFRRNIISERLAKILSSSKATSSPKRPSLRGEESQGLMARTIRRLHELDSPKETPRKKKIRFKLMQAGYRSRQAYRNYLAAKITLGVLFPCIYVVVSRAGFFSSQVIAISCILLVVGYFIPNFLLSHFTEKRRERIFKGLPDALDLMVICVTAGLGLDMTFKRVSDELKSLWKDLSDEFYLTNMEIRAGVPREEGYKNMALRTGVSEVQSLMSMLIQTSRFGTSVSAALRVHSDGMRTKRRQLAEEKAAQISVKMTIPLILFIFPALLVVLIGPAAIKIIQTLLPALGGG